MRAAVAVVLLLLLSGCGKPTLSSAGKDVAPAGSLLSKAMANAQAWSPDALLTSVDAYEVATGSNASAQLEKARQADAHFAAEVPASDDNVGDGKAAAWAFTFQDGKSALDLVLLPSGEVTYTKERTAAGIALQLSGWTVDSDQAASLAAIKEPAYADLKPRADQGSASLQHDGNRTEWILALRSDRDPAHPAAAIVVVDAQSGNVRLQGKSGITANVTVAPLPPREKGSARGTVAGSAVKGAFTTKGDHGKVGFYITLDNPQPLVTVNVDIEGPAGAHATFTARTFAGGIGGGTGSATIGGGKTGDVAAGAYSYTVSQQNALQGQDFTLSFCTDGAGTHTEPACPENL